MEHRACRDFTLQWHLTDQCNLQCAHCYQQQSEDHGALGPEQWWTVVEQYRQLLDSLSLARGRITLTGGEPLVVPQLFGLLARLAKEKSRFDVALLTNGTLIDAAMAQKLASLEVAYVQVSIDGTEKTHDAIRGPGSYQRAVEGLRHLADAKVCSLISFTAHRQNWRDFPEVARLGRQLGVSRVWADRLIPMGRGAALKELVLSPTETREFSTLIHSAQISNMDADAHNPVAARRALQFLVSGDAAYRCAAGSRLLAMLPNGDLLACRRLPIRLGRVTDTPLVNIFRENSLMRLLQADIQSEGCRNCAHQASCNGGLRCLAWALLGDFDAPDPGCWLA